jgi:hypothetical protein
MKKQLGLLLLLCFLTACVGPRIVKTALHADAPSPYPTSFRVQHRVKLTVRGRQVDFTGYLMVKNPDTWRAVAFGEFGIGLFDMIRVPSQGPKIVSSTCGIPNAWLIVQGSDIIENLFVHPPAGGAGSPDGRFQVVGRHAVYEVAYSKYAVYRGTKQKIPRHILLEDKKNGVRLEAELLKFEPMKMPKEYFGE